MNAGAKSPSYSPDHSPGPVGTRRAGRTCRKVAFWASTTCPGVYEFCARVSGLYLLADRILDVCVVVITGRYWNIENNQSLRFWMGMQILWLFWGAKLCVMWVMIFSSTTRTFSITDFDARLEKMMTSPNWILTIVLSAIPYSELCILPAMWVEFRECCMIFCYLAVLPIMWLFSPIVLILQHVFILTGRLCGDRPVVDLQFTVQEWMEVWICLPQLTFQYFSLSIVADEMKNSEKLVLFISILLSFIGVINAMRVWCYHYEDFFPRAEDIFNTIRSEFGFNSHLDAAPRETKRTPEKMNEVELLKRAVTKNWDDDRKDTPIDKFRDLSNTIFRRISSREDTDFFDISYSSDSSENSISSDIGGSSDIEERSE